MLHLQGWRAVGAARCRKPEWARIHIQWRTYVSDSELAERRRLQKTRRYLTWGSMLTTTAAAFGILAYFKFVKNAANQHHAALVSSESIGTPKIGGPWTLWDQNGRVVSSDDLRGKYLLIYFGFSFCPDICPDEMEKQAQIVERVEKKFGLGVVQPLFISVDCNRDTVAQVKDYCADFHPNLIGLTGPPNIIKKVTRAFRVYYNEGIKSTDDDYLVDHSIIQYFMDRNGKFVDFFGKNMTIDEAVDKINDKIKTDREGRPT